MVELLIIEDEKRVADLLKAGLEECGYNVSVAYDGNMGLRLFRQHQPDLVVSDIILPGKNGFEVVKQIRSINSTIPILMLTALGTTDDKLEGFDAGADDYMVKPFDLRELEARIKALLRRQRPETDRPQAGELRYSDLVLDVQKHTVTRSGKDIRLTPKEFNLLRYMMENAEAVVSRLDISEKVWQIYIDTGTNFIDVYINYLRNKVDRDFPVKLIHTKQGVGFILSDKL